MKQEILTLESDSGPLEIALAHRIASGALLFFIHGLGCSGNSFRHVWRREEFQDISLVIPDLPGFGASGRPASFPYTMEAHARICEQVLERFDFDRLHLVVHSMGGAVGLLLSSSLLETAASFVNIEGNLVREDCALVSREAAKASEAEFTCGLFFEFKDRFAQYEGRYLDMDPSDPLAFYRSARSLVKWSDSGELLDRFKGLGCRKVYVHGEDSSHLPVLSRLGEIKKAAIPRSTHFPMIDHPDGFYDALHAFVTGS